MANRILATIATGALLAVHTLGAQRVRGNVVLPDGANPAVGMIVVAADERDTPLRSALTDERGAFDLLMPRAGRVEVRVLRIGFHPTVAGVFDLAAGETQSVRVVLAGAAIGLPTVTVRGADLCASRTRPDFSLRACGKRRARR